MGERRMVEREAAAAVTIAAPIFVGWDCWDGWSLMRCRSCFSTSGGEEDDGGLSCELGPRY
jgi:hypothetical protein